MRTWAPSRLVLGSTDNGAPVTAPSAAVDPGPPALRRGALRAKQQSARKDVRPRSTARGWPTVSPFDPTGQSLGGAMGRRWRGLGVHPDALFDQIPNRVQYGPTQMWCPGTRPLTATWRGPVRPVLRPSGRGCARNRHRRVSRVAELMVPLARESHACSHRLDRSTSVLGNGLLAYFTDGPGQQRTYRSLDYAEPSRGTL